MPADVLALLQSQLHLDNDDVYHVRGLLRRVDLFALADINLPHLKYDPWTPLTPSRFAGINCKGRPGELFNAIRQGDLMVHHPYHSFQSSTQMFVEAAATRDPQVLAIKQTLYRTSDNSQIIAALIQAAEAGKQVAVSGGGEGAFRRGEKHRMGAQTGGGRLPRRLWPGRPQDALQGVDGDSSGRRRPARLLSYRHRQLQCQDGWHLHRPRLSLAATPISAPI